MTREEAKKDLHYKLQFNTLNINDFINSIYDDFENKLECIDTQFNEILAEKEQELKSKRTTIEVMNQLNNKGKSCAYCIHSDKDYLRLANNEVIINYNKECKLGIIRNDMPKNFYCSKFEKLKSHK